MHCLIQSDNMTQKTHTSFVFVAVRSFCEKKACKEFCEPKFFKQTARLPSTVITEFIY